MNQRRALLRPGLGVALVCLALCAGACTSDSRIDRTEPDLLARRAREDSGARAEFDGAVKRLSDRIYARVKAHEADPALPAPTVDILALSGGGDYGAFGAGVLVGWGQIGDPALRRPDFDGVTGVSTGALLAPFAFLGTDEECLRVESFYRNPKADWIESRGLLFFLPHFPSFMDTKGLERDLNAAIDPGTIDRIGARAGNGRLLVVSATSLDYGEQRVWELGHAAAEARTDADRDRVRRILRASAAIPAVFPPVEVDGTLYADGGVTANVLLRLDPDAPESLIGRWRAEHPDRPLPKVRYWIIVNNQAHAPPRTVQPRWPSIISPSLATAIRSATFAEIRWLAAQARYTNAAHETDIEVRVLSIPDEWRPPVPGDFKKETMDSLADLGRRLGSDSTSWTEWVKSAPAAESSGSPEPR